MTRKLTLIGHQSSWRFDLELLACQNCVILISAVEALQLVALSYSSQSKGNILRPVLTISPAGARTFINLNSLVQAPCSSHHVDTVFSLYGVSLDESQEME